MKKTTKKQNIKAIRSSKELAQALDITSHIDQALMIYKTELSSLAVKSIENSGLSVNEIVERSGVARSKVSAIKNGALAGISLELFFKVIMGCGKRITIKAA
ncbi:XRE family transcriptional regulator [Bdellovibrio bacteriovorus]|uniref:XRE family transcriptional regulator n=1 Tax=Bdellovibrio TaxID=958 RepID=UPI0035A97088